MLDAIGLTTRSYPAYILLGIIAVFKVRGSSQPRQYWPEPIEQQPLYPVQQWQPPASYVDLDKRDSGSTIHAKEVNGPTEYSGPPAVAPQELSNRNSKVTRASSTLSHAYTLSDAGASTLQSSTMRSGSTLQPSDHQSYLSSFTSPPPVYNRNDTGLDRTYSVQEKLERTHYSHEPRY